MKVAQAVKYCLDYHAQNSQKNTTVNYQILLSRHPKDYKNIINEALLTGQMMPDTTYKIIVL